MCLLSYMVLSFELSLPFNMLYPVNTDSGLCALDDWPAKSARGPRDRVVTVLPQRCQRQYHCQDLDR